MDDSYMRAAEQITLALRRAEARTIAFTSPEPASGTSAAAALAAAVLARSGQPTLLIDLSVAAKDLTDGPAWTPGQGEAKIAASGGEAGYARLSVQAGPEVRFLFDNMDWFRGVLDVDLAAYDYIILDLSSFLDRPEGVVNPFAAAAACDALILVCRRGRITRQKIKQTMDMARTTGCRPFGIVMTQGDYVSVGEEIARTVRRLFFFFPWLGRRIGQRATTSEILS